MSRLLRGLSEAERARGQAVLSSCPTLALPVGAVRPPARLPVSAGLVVEEGLVLLASQRPGASRRMVLGLARPGAVLLPPVGDERLEALADSWLTVVTPSAHAELACLPGAAAALGEGLAETVRDRQESLAHFACVRHVDRVREKLLQLARAHGKVVPGGVRLDLPLTHELLGEMVGSARETVTWALAELQREGFARRDGRSYRLAVSPEALAS